MLYTDTLDKPDVGLIYADSILVLLKPMAESSPYKLKYAEELLSKGDILFKLHFFNEAYAAYFDARSVMENAGNDCDKSSFLSHFYRRLADISYGKGSFAEAAAWQKKALSNLNACGHIPGDDYLTQGTLDNIALSYMLCGKLDSALVYFDKALKFIAVIKIAGVHPARELEEAEGVILDNRGTLIAYLRKLSDNVS